MPEQNLIQQVEALQQQTRDLEAQRDHLQQSLEETEQRYQQQLQAIHRQTQDDDLLDRVRSTLARELDLDTVIRTVVEGIAETFGYALVSVYWLEGDALHLQHQVGYDTVIKTIALNEGVSGRTVRTKQAILLEDVQADPEFLGAIEGITSEICVPLFDEGKVVGTLNVESKQGVRLTQKDLHLMTALGQHVSTAIWRARLYTEVRESEAHNRALIDTIPDMLVRMHRDGYYTEARAAFDFDPLIPIEEFAGKRIEDVLPPATAKERKHNNQKVLDTRETIVYEYQLEHRSVMRDYEARMVAVGDDEVLALIRDITQRKQNEAQRLELALEKERVQVLSDFVQNASHDFKTPLATISTALYLLQKNTDPDKQQARIDVLNQQVRRLNELIDGLLTMTRLDSGEPFDDEDLDLCRLANEVLDSHKPQAQAKNHAMTLENNVDSLPIQADSDKLKQAMGHLVKNALDFTPDGGNIQLRCYAVDDMAIFEVQDNGAGITPDDLPRIFDRLYRADKARSTDMGHMGLGLSIARKIAENHQGELEAESTFGQGSIFRLRLPQKSV